MPSAGYGTCSMLCSLRRYYLICAGPEDILVMLTQILHVMSAYVLFVILTKVPIAIFIVNWFNGLASWYILVVKK